MAMAPSKHSTVTPLCSTSPCTAMTMGTSFRALGLLKRYSSWAYMQAPLGGGRMGPGRKPRKPMVVLVPGASQGLLVGGPHGSDSLLGPAEVSGVRPWRQG